MKKNRSAIFMILAALLVISLLLRIDVVRADINYYSTEKVVESYSHLNKNRYNSYEDLFSTINSTSSLFKNTDNTIKDISKSDSPLNSTYSISGSAVTIGNSWADFVAAAADTNVSTINLTEDLTATNSLTIFVSSKHIYLNGHTINMGSNTMIVRGSVILTDPKFISSSKTGIFQFDTGSLSFEGTGSFTGEQFICPATNRTSSAVLSINFQFLTMTMTNTSKSTPTIEANTAGFYIDVINSNINDKSAQFLHSDKTRSKSVIKKLSISQTSVITSSDPTNSTNAHFINSGASSTSNPTNNSDAPTILIIKGGSSISVNKNNSVGYDGLIRLYSSQSQINLTDASSLDVTNDSGSAIVESGTGSTFNVSGKNTILQATRAGGSANTLNAAVRFVWSGGMAFKVSNQAKVVVTQAADLNAAAIRMYGGDNTVDVSGGAEFDLYNKSNGTSPNGIDYEGSGSKNSFSILDDNSQVLIQSSNGQGIVSNSDINVTAGTGTSFVVRGGRRNTAIFQSSGILNFIMETPRYFDFMNTASSTSLKTASLLFRGASKSTMQHASVPLSVWASGSDVTDNPTKSWNSVSAKYSGAFFATVSDINSVDGTFEEYMSTNKGLSRLGRMTSNTAAAQVENVPLQPTNADKYIWVLALMPAENNEYRSAYDNEVYADVELTNPDGTVETFTGNSIQKQNYYEYSSETSIFGAIRINVGHYLQAKSKIKVLRVWRNDSSYDSSAAIKSSAEDIKYQETTVIDATPPNPAVITSTGVNGDITPNTEKISGTGEALSIVSWKVIHQNGTTTTGNSTTQSNSSGNWALTGLSGLKNGDRLQVFLTDENKNINPSQTTVFHDTTFQAATIIPVNGQLALGVPLQINFGHHFFYDAKNIPVYSITGALTVTDTRNTSGWSIELQNSGITNGQSTVPLFYGNGTTSVVVQNAPITIFTKNTAESTWTPYNISDGWTYSAESMTDTPKGPFLKAAPDTTQGTYTGTLTWTLTDGIR